MTEIPFIINPQKPPQGMETYEEKAWRKVKEQPLVPLGALGTCTALIIAFVRQRQGRSQDFNYWLRWRIGAQAATIIAVVGGAYALGNTKQQQDARARDQDRMLANAAKDREDFGTRLAAAEEAHAAESSIRDEFARSAPAGVQSVRRAEGTAGSVPPPSTPAGVESLRQGGSNWWNPASWWSSGSKSEKS